MSRYYECPACRTIHHEWDMKEERLMCEYCGWRSGDRPFYHPEVGDRLVLELFDWWPKKRKPHPKTEVRLLEAHRHITEKGVGSTDKVEPDILIEAKDLPRWLKLRNYPYATVEVVKLPEEWKPVAHASWYKPSDLEMVRREAVII